MDVREHVWYAQVCMCGTHGSKMDICEYPATKCRLQVILVPKYKNIEIPSDGRFTGVDLQAEAKPGDTETYMGTYITPSSLKLVTKTRHLQGIFLRHVN